jgi:hypothetical protein
MHNIPKLLADDPAAKADAMRCLPPASLGRDALVGT